MRTMLLAVLATLAAVIAGGAAGAEESDDHPCRQVVTCDCDNIDAGLLSKAWRADCRQCEEKIIEACENAYPPISSAMAAGGYCENACSTFGPNPYPKAPPKAVEDDSEAVLKVGEMRLVCPLTMKLETVDIDGKPASGCVAGSGQREGVWMIVDEAAGTVVEIIYIDGNEMSRTERPL